MVLCSGLKLHSFSFLVVFKILQHIASLPGQTTPGILNNAPLILQFLGTEALG